MTERDFIQQVSVILLADKGFSTRNSHERRNRTQSVNSYSGIICLMPTFIRVMIIVLVLLAIVLSTAILTVIHKD